MRTTAQRRAVGARVSAQPELLRLHLEIGSETVEVRIGADGLHFLDQSSDEAPPVEGVLGWDEAIALALLPEDVRLSRERTAA